MYKEAGFENREDYLGFLSEEYGISADKVVALAELLGHEEDFDMLVSALEFASEDQNS